MTDTLPCTCAPDERPYPCQHQYALGECRKAFIRELIAERDALIHDIERCQDRNTQLVAEVERLRALLREARSDYRDIVHRLGEVHLVRACEHQHDDDFVPMYDSQTLAEYQKKAESLRLECERAWSEVDRIAKQIGEMTTERLQDQLTHGNIMGRIAVALFGKQNNVTDEECVAQAAEVVRERDSLRQHLHDEHQRHVGTMDERDAALADLAAAQKTLNDHLLSEAAETMRADKATSELAAARALLREAYVAMREPTGEWHDIKCNTVLPKIHAALWEKP